MALSSQAQAEERVAVPGGTGSMSGYGTERLKDSTIALESVLQNGNADALAFEISDQHGSAWWDSAILGGQQADRLLRR